MKTKLIVAGLLSAFTVTTATAQTLFTYGPNKADAADFVRAFNKNNTPTAANRSKLMKEYLDLYINSRLKIKEAYNRGYDTLPQIENEVNNLRAQIIEGYINDPETMNRFVNEAFTRSQKDIHAAHIFISFAGPNGTVDTLAAYKKAQEALKALAQKEDFGKVAARFSDDPAVKTNNGDLGYITVFTLPYEMENLVYGTAPGQYSTLYRSKAGYHIFKNLGERKAMGRIKAQQILLAYPPGATDADKKQLAKLADSLYTQLKKGADLAALATAYSNDYISANAGGNIPEIGVGQYDAVFENALLSLKKDGDISRPFATSHGWHIVKRIGIRPVVTNASDKANQEELKQRIVSDERWKSAKDFIYPLVIKKAGLQKMKYDDAALWALTDSLLDYKPGGAAVKGMTFYTPLFRIGDTTLQVKEWVSYAQLNRYKADRSGVKPNTELMNEFVNASLYDYYRTHLEDFNNEFKTQMNEFKDGNLFFEIMQQEIWNKAQADSAALLALYEKNKSHYNWKQSADAVIFFCSDVATAKQLQDEIKKTPANWKKFAEALNEKVVADSSRYEWEQLPGLGKTVPKPNSITPLSANPADNTASFAYIFNVHTQPSPRSFAEAKGLVVNDYQAELEASWINALKKKYPVTVDQKVLAQIMK